MKYTGDVFFGSVEETRSFIKGSTDF